MNSGATTAEAALQILLLEDDPDDATLTIAALRRSGLRSEIEVVATREDFEAALERRAHDVILTDHNLGSYNAFGALEAAKRLRPEVPLLLVSGTVGEEMAAEFLQQGATDYVLKGNLARLPAAIERARRHTEEKQARRRLEQQLRQAQLMEAIGRLASGMAHDFNNLLTVITGYAELIGMQLAAEDPARPGLGEIRAACERGAALTRQLLTFSRAQPGEARFVDLSRLMDELARMLSRLIGADVALTADLTRPLWLVRADPAEISRVIMNMAINARDAMPLGGRLWLETRNRAVEDPAAAELGLATGEYAVLVVGDSGTGMTPEIKAQIFEPFFTTKDAGKGTGLGLATAYGIVRQAGGTIAVESAPGKGTVFELYFPRVRPELAMPRERTTDGTAPRGNETLLLVEDDVEVRSLVQGVLEQHGYRVLTAGRPAEALQQATLHAEEIELLVTDCWLPEMNGFDLADRLVAERPPLKVLYVSGHLEGGFANRSLALEREAFLAKPFLPDQLLVAVRRLLDLPPVSGGHRIPAG